MCILVGARSRSVGMHLDETRGAQWLVYRIDTPWVLVIASRDFFSEHLSPIYQRVMFTTSC